MSATPAPEFLSNFSRASSTGFYRVDKARSRENGGTGLGLAIAKWAVEVNGGHLTLEPDSGVGSCFRITLCRKRPLNRKSETCNAIELRLQPTS